MKPKTLIGLAGAAVVIVAGWRILPRIAAALQGAGRHEQAGPSSETTEAPADGSQQD